MKLKNLTEIVKDKRFLFAAALTVVSVGVMVIQKRTQPMLKVEGDINV